MRIRVPNYQDWVAFERPGYFGRRRDEIVEAYDRRFGREGWTLMWLAPLQAQKDFHDACLDYYEGSYFTFLQTNPEIVDKICRYGEVIDNAETNVKSGTDYLKQESYATHIQDIAIRRVLLRLRRSFMGPKDKILQVRGPETDGYKLGLQPGQIPFNTPKWITQPSLRPEWAQEGSVEDAWQSLKWVCVPKVR